MNLAPSDTYSPAQKSKDEIIFDNIEYSKRLKLQPNEERDSVLPVMYWTPKMHKTPSGCRFIIASKNCSTKPLSKAVSSAFKLIFNQVERFHTKAKFFSNYNKFWVLQNADPSSPSLITSIGKNERSLLLLMTSRPFTLSYPMKNSSLSSRKSSTLFTRQVTKNTSPFRPMARHSGQKTKKVCLSPRRP